MRAMLFSSCALTFLVAGVLSADDRAATSQLPGALQALGITGRQVASVDQAHQVRGQGGCVVVRCNPRPNCSPPPPPPPPSNCQPCQGGGVYQSKSFAVTGTATGQVVLMEGVVGEFQHSNQSSGNGTVVQGQFGGLSGTLGSDSNGNLAFAVGGKALQETVTFEGQYQQVFTQTYRR